MDAVTPKAKPHKGKNGNANIEAQREAYLDALAPDGWYPDFWISKLHFYISGLPFYNFPYTFGYLLSTGLFALSQGAGPDFPGQYRQLLIADRPVPS